MRRSQLPTGTCVNPPMADFCMCTKPRPLTERCRACGQGPDKPQPPETVRQRLDRLEERLNGIDRRVGRHDLMTTRFR